MKVGIVGSGAVGSSAAYAMVTSSAAFDVRRLVEPGGPKERRVAPAQIIS